MRKVMALGLVGILGAMIAGCGPLPAYKDDGPTPPQVHFDELWLQGQVRVSIPTPQRVGAGQLHVTARLRNTTGFAMNLEYKPAFVDERGQPVDNSIDLAWQPVALPGYGYQDIEFTSMSAIAKDFRVQIRKAK